MTKTTLAALVCSALIAGSAQASVTIEGTTFDDTSAVAGQNLVLNGAGLRKKLFFRVYTAGLYLPAKAQTLEAVLSQTGAVRVRLILMRNVSAKSFVDALKDGLKDNTPEKELAAINAEVTRKSRGLLPSWTKSVTLKPVMPWTFPLTERTRP